MTTTDQLIKTQNEVLSEKTAQLEEANKILNKVTTLRNYQKSYFASRDRATLDKCKLLEKEIDNDLKSYSNKKEYNLFNQNF